MNITVELVPAEDGDACPLCEEPVDAGELVVFVASSLTPDEGFTVCVRCAQAVGKAAERH